MFNSTCLFYFAVLLLQFEGVSGSAFQGVLAMTDIVIEFFQRKSDFSNHFSSKKYLGNQIVTN